MKEAAMKRPRSPGYPSISLKECVLRVAKLYAMDGRAELDRAAVLRGLGYGSDNGASQAVLSALRKTKLVAKHGNTFRVTRLAERIVSPSSNEDKVRAIEEAAKAPSIFAELIGRFGDEPPADEDLAEYLLGTGFSRTALPILIASFRDSVEFLKATRSADRASYPVQFRPMDAHPFRVAIFNDRVEVTAALLDRRAVDRLIATLEIAKAILPPTSGSQAEGETPLP
jgi:hypothetical protein